MIRMRQFILKPTTGKLLVGWGLWLFSVGVWTPFAESAENGSAVASALRGLFNPGSASDANTMGLLQRSNFIERVAGQGGRIEMAFVVDATESMEEQLQGIQQRLLSMMDDVRRVAGDEVYIQLVLYRDSGAASGVVELPLGKGAFSRDLPSLQAALQKLVPESGAPYFHEAVDQGLYVALNELPWSKTGQVKRWVILIGDAPPFDRGFREPESGAERKYSTEQLIQQAQQRGIEINAIVCPTRAKDQAVYDEVIGLTRFFCGEITSQTGGWMLDLSDPQLLETVTQAAQAAMSDFMAIEPITQAELDELRAAAQDKQTAIAPLGRVRVAVMPHLDLEKMTFSRRDPGVRFADEMRSQLETVGLDVDVVSNYELERVYNRLDVHGMSREAALQQIGMGVTADYVFWGALLAGPPHKIESGILDTKSGKFVVALPGGIETQIPIRAQMCSTVLDALAQASKQVGNPLQLARVERRFKTRLVATTEEVERLILTARGRIADAMQLQLGVGNGSQLWEEAQAELESALTLEPNNPVVNSLLANVYFAQFQILQAAGDTVGGAAKRRLANQFAGEAKQNADQVFESDRIEIEADFSFYRGNFQQAAASYQQLAEQGTTLAHVDRARWMLAGIYSGDWGISHSAAELVDARQARAQIVQLLAFFPESPHTKLLEKHLLWDDVQGATLSANLPRTHVELPIEP
jgi:hypothetical protein